MNGHEFYISSASKVIKIYIRDKNVNLGELDFDRFIEDIQYYIYP